MASTKRTAGDDGVPPAKRAKPSERDPDAAVSLDNAETHQAPDFPSDPSAETPMWLDCDPGHDDAFAILLALGARPLDGKTAAEVAAAPDSPLPFFRHRLIGVSTVVGNQTLAKTTLNALKVLALAGAAETVPVVQGQNRPLLRQAADICPDIHGESGLDGSPAFQALVPPVEAETGVPAVVRMAEVIGAQTEGVTLVATGALTNVALLLTLYPELAGNQIRRIVFMGGAMGIGNTHAVAEFNIENDPEAAQIVVDFGTAPGLEVVMVPLEVTHTVLFGPSVREATLARVPDPLFTVIDQWMAFFAKTYADVFGFVDGPPLHDPCAVFYALVPAAFTARRMRVDIETASPLGRGQTVCDVWGYAKRPANVVVCEAINVDLFWEHMVEALGQAAAVCVLPKDTADTADTA